MRKIQTTILSSILIVLFTGCNLIGGEQTNEDSIYVASWNVENLFDIEDDENKNDAEFLPDGKKMWDEVKLDKKIKNLAYVINYLNSGCAPDIIGFQEVENVNVLKRLIYSLSGRNYIFAYRESPDARGIDACLIYDMDVFDVVDLQPIRVKIPTGYKTRDIVHLVLEHKIHKTKLHVFVNHWPSRLGGQEKSEPNRIAVAKILRTKVDSLQQNEDDKHIIILGDFNDEPANESIQNVLNAKNFKCDDPKIESSELINLSFQKYSEGEGSYLYGSDWNMLDQIITSAAFVDGKGIEYKCGSFEVIKPDFMIAKSGNRKGGPFSTYRGSVYQGGYSDHFPVGAKFYFKKVNE